MISYKKDSWQSSSTEALKFWIRIQKLDSSHIHARLAKIRPTRRLAPLLKKAPRFFRESHANRAEKIPTETCEP
jgi:hypothetical protein